MYRLYQKGPVQSYDRGKQRLIQRSSKGLGHGLEVWMQFESAEGEQKENLLKY